MGDVIVGLLTDDDDDDDDDGGVYCVLGTRFIAV